MSSEVPLNTNAKTAAPTDPVAADATAAETENSPQSSVNGMLEEKVSSPGFQQAMAEFFCTTFHQYTADQPWPTLKEFVELLTDKFKADFGGAVWFENNKFSRLSLTYVPNRSRFNPRYREFCQSLKNTTLGENSWFPCLTEIEQQGQSPTPSLLPFRLLDTAIGKVVMLHIPAIDKSIPESSCQFICMAYEDFASLYPQWSMQSDLLRLSGLVDMWAWTIKQKRSLMQSALDCLARGDQMTQVTPEQLLLYWRRIIEAVRLFMTPRELVYTQWLWLRLVRSVKEFRDNQVKEKLLKLIYRNDDAPRENLPKDLVAALLGSKLERWDCDYPARWTATKTA